MGEAGGGYDCLHLCFRIPLFADGLSFLPFAGVPAVARRLGCGEVLSPETQQLARARVKAHWCPLIRGWLPLPYFRFLEMGEAGGGVFSVYLHRGWRGACTKVGEVPAPSVLIGVCYSSADQPPNMRNLKILRLFHKPLAEIEQ
jgi:hypothetical protein